MASAPSDWWPISEGDPVPGDPETLAGLGGKMKNAAAAIASIASQLPKLASSEIWDSDAGDAFRTKSTSVASDIRKVHGRFQAVATALGSSTVGTGYAATLQEYQGKAYAAADAVVGAGGSEAVRLRTWSQLLAANDGASPLVPPPEGGNKPGVASPGDASGQEGTTYPLASPGSIPADLPVFPTDSAEVRSLKGTYNDQLATLRSSTTTVNNAANIIASAARAAAGKIQQVIDGDGLNNPSGWDAFVHGVESFYDNHVVGVLKDISKVCGIISMVCGIIALVLTFIGLPEVAALFESIALLAQLLQTVCDVVLLITGKGDWVNVVVDVVGLITFGLGGGLISKIGDTTDALGTMAKAFGETEDVAKAAEEAGDVTAVFKQSDAAMDALEDMKKPSFLSGVLQSAKDSLDLKSVMTKAIESYKDPATGAELAKLGLGGALAKGLKGALTFDDPGILSDLDKMSGYVDEMKSEIVVTGSTDGPSLLADADKGIVHLNVFAQVVRASPPAARAMVDTAAVYRNIFRVVQATAVGSSVYGVVS